MLCNLSVGFPELEVKLTCVEKAENAQVNGKEGPPKYLIDMVRKNDI